MDTKVAASNVKYLRDAVFCHNSPIMNMVTIHLVSLFSGDN